MKQKITFLILLFSLLSQWVQAQTQLKYYRANGVNWAYTVSGTEATITGTTADSRTLSGPLNIPATVSDGTNTYNVTAIGDKIEFGARQSFWSFKKLTSLTIPEGVKTIGKMAFSDCIGLTGTLTLPSSLVSIGDYAFSGCTGLTGTLTIPNSVTSLGQDAFNSCIGLTKVILSTSMSETGKYAFNDCKGITEIEIPSNVKTISDGTFIRCSGFTGTFTIPSTVTSIGTSAFLSCNGVTNFIIPASVTTIGDQAFRGCENLTSVTIPTGVSTIEDFTFQDCTKLSSVTIPSTVTTIKRGAFEYCRSLSTITIPTSVTSIGNVAFHESGLTHITIPGNVLTIGDEAFRYCKELASLTLNDGIQTIGSQTFADCEKLAGTLTIPGSIISIGMSAFNGDKLLTKLVFQPGNLTTIGAGAFGGCTGLTGDLVLPNSLKDLKDGAFYGCTGYHGHLTLSNQLESIGKEAFERCSNITGRLLLPASLKTIGDYAFSECSSLSGDLVIPAGLTSIGDFAFRRNPHLSGHINIPKACNKFALSSFYGTGIESYTCENTSPVMPENLMDYQFGEVIKAFPSLSYVDATKYDFDIDNHHFSLSRAHESSLLKMVYPYTMVYFKANYDSWIEDTDINAVCGDKCKNFVAYDGHNYPIKYPFTAIKANTDRVFNNVSGKAVSTLYLPYPTDLPDGMVAYELVNNGTDINGDRAFFFSALPHGTRLAANHPYLVQITDGQSHTLPEMHNVAVPVTPDIETTAVQATATADWKLYGTTERINNAVAYDKKAYYLNGNKWWAVQSGVENDYIAPFRCFISSPTGAAAAKSFAMVLDNDHTTAIDVHQLEKQTEADIRAGKHEFFSIDGKYMGTNYDSLAPGQIYIVNGKKFYKL